MRRTTRIDLHVHTKGSDGIGTPEQVARAAVEAGLDGLCITDHHLTYTAAGLEVARACRKEGLLVFHGCEYSTDDGHLLVFGVNVEELNLGRYPKMQEAVDKVVAAGGVAIPAHPYKGYRRLLGESCFQLKRATAFEVANGQCAVKNEEANRKAKLAARKMKLGTTGGSDAHFPRCVGICYTEFAGQVRTEKDLLRALRSKRYRAVVSRKRMDSELKVWKTWNGNLEARLAAQRIEMKRERAAREGVPFTPQTIEAALDTTVDPFALDRKAGTVRRSGSDGRTERERTPQTNAS